MMQHLRPFQMTPANRNALPMATLHYELSYTGKIFGSKRHAMVLVFYSLAWSTRTAG